MFTFRFLRPSEIGTYLSARNPIIEFQFDSAMTGDKSARKEVEDFSAECPERRHQGNQERLNHPSHYNRRQMSDSDSLYNKLSGR